MNKRLILFITLFAATIVYLGYLVPNKSGVQVGEVAPVFAVQGPDNKVARLSDYRGKVILLNFWATWCPPCVWEMPSLNRLYSILKSEGFEILAVSIDEGGWNTINAFTKKVPLSFPVLSDPSTDVAALYGSYQLPETFIIGADGTVLKKYAGPREWDREDMIAEIKSFIATSQRP